MSSSKQTKVVHLGGKSKQQPSNKENKVINMSATQTNVPQFKIPYSVSKPIVIRYIDPRIVPLFMELGKITKMVQNIVSSSSVSPSGEKQEQIQTLIRSTKEIKEKVSVIMQENQVLFSGSSGFGNIMNKTEQVKSEYEYQLDKSKTKQSQLERSTQMIQNIKTEQIDMVAILNRVSQRLQELQNENQSLKVKLTEQMARSSQLQRQKQQLQQSLRQRDNLGRVKISQLQQELTSLTNNSSVISSRIAKLNLLISQ